MVNIYTEYDPEDQTVPARLTSIGHTPTKQRKPTKKASYESNADVQRWLKEQALVEEDVVKSAFNPTFLASLRDAPWILSSLTQFYEENLITDVLSVIKSGKEATVYCCSADPSTGAEYLAAKIYRPRMFRSLKNDAIYRQNRVQYDLDGRVTRGYRHKHANKKRNERERAFDVSSWISYEYETQSLLFSIDADVPRPVAQIGNAVLMEYIGDLGEPAPLLREVRLMQEEAQPLFECILRNIEQCLAYDRIHGDLSEYNILYWRGAVTLIDFAQAVDPHQNPDVFPLLLRDIERVCHYFARYGVSANAETLAAEMWIRQQSILR